MSAATRATTGVTGQQKKKLVIKPFKTQPKLPDNFETDTWNKLREAIQAVHSKSSVNTSKEELYRAVEDLCVHKLAPTLYAKLYEQCDAHIAAQIESLNDQTPDHTAFLTIVDDVWQDHCDHMLTIRNIYLYLDRSHVLQTPGLLSIWDMGLKLFRDHLQSRPHLEMKTVIGLLAQVENERNGQKINHEVVKRLLRMLLALQTYHERFEIPFIEDSARYFTAEGQRLLTEVATSQFLVHVEVRLQQAVDMVQNYIDPSSRKALIHVIEQHLLNPHTNTLLDRGFEPLLNADKLEDLHRMFSLFRRIGCEDPLREAYSGYIRRHGEECINDTARDKDMVSELLVFQQRMEDTLNSSFENSDRFRYALKSAFEYFINVRQNKPAEYIARFVDKKLRGEKGVSDDEVEATLDRILTLFRHLTGKDTFEAFYRKLLAKRLLLGKSASFDLERSMIAKLKAECGSNFTGKLEGMFKDIDLSRDLMAQYSQFLGEPVTGRRDIDCTFQVLTTGYWPANLHVDIAIPAEIVPYQDRFKGYYNNKYQGRRLMWAHSLDRCVVTARFPKGKKELELTLYQTLVLLPFNAVDSMSFVDIKEQTRLEDGELRRTLQSLACGQIGTRVLTKVPKGKDVADTDYFEFNQEFTTKLYRIKINTIQLKETVEETEKTHEEVFRDRQYQVDAAIVRVMKARKTLTHNTLLNELFSQLKFPARVADLKKRIESLIEREYLERDASDASVYNYLA